MLSSSKTLEEHITGSGIRTDTTNIITAKKLLTTHGLDLPAAGTMLKELSQAVFEFSIAANLGALQTDILRAIAILLHEAEQSMNMATLLDRIENLIEGPIATLEENVTTLADITETHKITLESAIKEVRGQLSDSALGIDNAMENAISSFNNHIQRETQDNGSNGPKSYADATKANIPAPLTKILSRSEGQARQILIDKRNLSSENTLSELTEAQLVTKASMALDILKKDEITVPHNLSFISARRLPHGGILYELDSTESVQWFNTPANRSNFLERFGADILIKDRTFQVIVENVPLSFTPEDQITLRDIEKKAGIKPNSITKARYIKPPQRRSPNQRTAHIILTLNSKEAANHSIKFGLSIAGKKVYGRKLISEPSRCLKCHSFNGSHVAATCPDEVDTCGTCGESHRTAECKVVERELFFCVNCNAHGHGAWDRECPIFKQKSDAHKARNEESKYRFYPTNDPLTWETTAEPNQNQTPTQPNIEQRNDQPSHNHHADRTSPPIQRRNNNTNPERSQPPQRATRNNPNLVPLRRQAQLDQWIPTPQDDTTPPTFTNNTPVSWAQYNTNNQDGPSGWD